MEEARETVRTIEVTRAVRSTSLSGVRVSAGDVIAIVDDELKLSAASLEDAVIEAIKGLNGQGSLITLYHGAETGEAATHALASNIRQRFPSYEVEVVFGGQPHYDYIVSVE
jgi:dihydroxyacetone kinase-like predicted kinase